MKKKILVVTPFLVCGLIVCLLIVGVPYIFGNGEKKIITSSTLKETINISKLSTAKFTYNGIATVYKDATKEKIKCHIRYNATVKAGVDMQKVDFEIDHKNKTVKVKLPKIKIKSYIVNEQPLSFIPNDTTVDLKEALVICKEDARQKAMESPRLMNLAEENLKSTIEALLYPLLESKEFKIIWD